MKKRLLGSRILSGILTVAMLFTMAPTTLTSFAAEAEPEGEVTIVDDSAEAEAVSSDDAEAPSEDASAADAEAPAEDEVGVAADEGAAEADAEAVQGSVLEDEDQEADQFDSYKDSQIAILKLDGLKKLAAFFSVKDGTATIQGDSNEALKNGVLNSDTAATGTTYFNSYYGYSFYIVPKVGYELVDAPVVLSGTVSYKANANSSAVDTEVASTDLVVEDLDEGDRFVKNAKNVSYLAASGTDYTADRYSWNDAKKITIKGIGDGSDFMKAWIQYMDGRDGYSVKKYLNIGPADGDIVKKKTGITIPVYDASVNSAGTIVYTPNTITPSIEVTYGEPIVAAFGEQDWDSYESIRVGVLTTNLTGEGSVTPDYNKIDSNTTISEITSASTYAADWAASYSVNKNAYYYVDKTENKISLNSAITSNALIVPGQSTTSAKKELAIVLTTQGRYGISAINSDRVTFALNEAVKRNSGNDIIIYKNEEGTAHQGNSNAVVAGIATVTDDAKGGLGDDLTMSAYYTDPTTGDPIPITVNGYNKNGNVTSVLKSISYWMVKASESPIPYNITFTASTMEGVEVTDTWQRAKESASSSAVNMEAYSTEKGVRQTVSILTDDIDIEQTVKYGIASGKLTTGEDLYLDVWPMIGSQINSVTAKTYNAAGTDSPAERTLTADEDGLYPIKGIKGFTEVTVNSGEMTDPKKVTFELPDSGRAYAYDVRTRTVIFNPKSSLSSTSAGNAQARSQNVVKNDYAEGGKDYTFYVMSDPGYSVGSVTVTVDGKTVPGIEGTEGKSLVIGPSDLAVINYGITAGSYATKVYTVPASYVTGPMTVTAKVTPSFDIQLVSNDDFARVTLTDGSSTYSMKNGDVVKVSGDNDVSLEIAKLNGAKISGVYQETTSVSTPAKATRAAVKRYATELNEKNGAYTIDEARVFVANAPLVYVYVLTDKEAVRDKDFTASFNAYYTNKNFVDRFDVTEDGLPMFAGGKTISDGNGGSLATMGSYLTSAKVQGTIRVPEIGGEVSRYNFDDTTRTSYGLKSVSWGNLQWTSVSESNANTTGQILWDLGAYGDNSEAVSQTGDNDYASVKFVSANDATLVTQQYSAAETFRTLYAVYERETFPHITTYRAGVDINISPLSSWFDDVSLDLYTKKAFGGAGNDLELLSNGIIRAFDGTPDEVRDSAVMEFSAQRGTGTRVSISSGNTSVKPILKGGNASTNGVIEWTVSAQSGAGTYKTVSSSNVVDSLAAITSSVSAGNTQAVTTTGSSNVIFANAISEVTSPQTIKIAANLNFADGSSLTRRASLDVITPDYGYIAIPNITTKTGTTVGYRALQLETTKNGVSEATVKFDVYKQVSGGDYVGSASDSDYKTLNSEKAIADAVKAGNLIKVSDGRIEWGELNGGLVARTASEISNKEAASSYTSYMDITPVEGQPGTFTIAAKRASNTPYVLELDASVGSFKPVCAAKSTVETVQSVKTHEVNFVTKDGNSTQYPYPVLSENYAAVTSYVDEWKTNSSATNLSDVDYLKDTLREGVILSNVPEGAVITLPKLDDFAKQAEINADKNKNTSTIVDPKKTIYYWSVSDGNTQTFEAPGEKIVVGDQNLTITAGWANRYSPKAGNSSTSSGDVLVINGNTVESGNPIAMTGSETIAYNTDSTKTGKIPLYVGYYPLDLETVSGGNIQPDIKYSNKLYVVPSTDNMTVLAMNESAVTGLLNGGTETEVTIGSKTLTARQSDQNNMHVRVNWTDNGAVYRVNLTGLKTTSGSDADWKLSIPDAKEKELEVGLEYPYSLGLLTISGNSVSVGNAISSGNVASIALTAGKTGSDAIVEIGDLESTSSSDVYPITGLKTGTDTLTLTIIDNMGRTWTDTADIKVNEPAITINAKITPTVFENDYQDRDDDGQAVNVDNTNKAVFYIGKNKLTVTPSIAASAVSTSAGDVKSWTVKTVSASDTNGLTIDDSISVGNVSGISSVSAGSVVIEPSKLGIGQLVISVTNDENRTYTRTLDVTTAGWVAVSHPDEAARNTSVKAAKGNDYTITADSTLSGVTQGEAVAAGEKIYIGVPYTKDEDEAGLYTVNLSGLKANWASTDLAEEFLGWGINTVSGGNGEARYGQKTADILANEASAVSIRKADMEASGTNAVNVTYYAYFSDAGISASIPDKIDPVRLSDEEIGSFSSGDGITISTTGGSNYVWVPVTVEPYASSEQVSVTAETILSGDGTARPILDLADGSLSNSDTGKGSKAGSKYNTLYVHADDDAYRWNNGADIELTAGNQNSGKDTRTDYAGIGKVNGRVGIAEITFKAGGKSITENPVTVYLNGEYKAADGKTYNMVDGANIKNTTATVGGATHYYDEDGVLATSKTWYDESKEKYILVDAHGEKIPATHSFVSNHQFDGYNNGRNVSGGDVFVYSEDYGFMYYINDDGTLFAGGIKNIEDVNYYYNTYGQKVTFNTHGDEIDEYRVYKDPVTGVAYQINKRTDEATELGVYLLTNTAWGEWTAPRILANDPEIQATFTYTPSKSGDPITETVNAKVVKKESEEVKIGTEDGTKVTYTMAATPTYPEKEGGEIEDVTISKTYTFDKNGLLTDEEGKVETYALIGDVKFDNWKYTKETLSATVDVSANYSILEDGVDTGRKWEDKRNIPVTKYVRREADDLITFTAEYTILDGTEKVVTADEIFVYSTGELAATYKLNADGVRFDYDSWKYTAGGNTATINVKAVYDVYDLAGTTLRTKDGKDDSQTLTLQGTPSEDGMIITFTAEYPRLDKDAQGNAIVEKGDSKKFVVATGEPATMLKLNGNVVFDENNWSYTAGETTAKIKVTAIYDEYDLNGVTLVKAGAKDDSQTLNVPGERDEKKGTITFTAEYTRLDNGEKVTSNPKKFNFSNGKETSETGESGTTPSEPVQDADSKGAWNLFYTDYYGADGIRLTLPTGTSEGLEALAKAEKKPKWMTYYDVSDSGLVTIKSSILTMSDEKKKISELKKAANAANSLITIPVFGTDETTNAEVQTGTFEYQLPVSYVKPTLKLTQTSGKIKKNVTEAQTVKTVVLEKKSTGAFEALDLSTQLDKEYGGPDLFTGKNLPSGLTAEITGEKAGEIALTTTAKTSSGKLNIRLANWNETISLTYNVGEVAKNVFTASVNGAEFTAKTATVTLNNTVSKDATPEAQVIEINVNGGDVDTSETDPVTITLPKNYSNGGFTVTGYDETSSLLTGNELTISYPEDPAAMKAGTYSFKLTTKDRASYTFKVVVNKNPLAKAITLKAQSQMNLVTGQKMVLIPTLKGITGKITNVAFDTSSAAKFEAEYVEELNEIIVSPNANADVKSENQTTTLTITAGGVECPIALKFKPAMVTPAVKLGKITMPKSKVTNGTAEGESSILSTYKAGGKTFTIAPTSVVFMDGRNVAAEDADNKGWYKITSSNALVHWNEDNGTIEVKAIANTKGQIKAVKVNFYYTGLKDNKGNDKAKSASLTFKVDTKN